MFKPNAYVTLKRAVSERGHMVEVSVEVGPFFDVLTAEQWARRQQQAGIIRSYKLKIRVNPDEAERYILKDKK